MFREELNSILLALQNEGPPIHRSIDIQSIDAGPGVGTSEKMVRIRMTQYFQINNLDLQCRSHLAPRDSKMHSVEKIMSSLNEAAGDGTGISINRPSMFEEIGDENLLQMSLQEIREF